MKRSKFTEVKDPETGKRVSRPNPKSEWVTVPVPHLRIVSDELWEKVQAKKARYGSQPYNKSRRAKHCSNGQQISVERLEGRVLAGIKRHLSQPRLLAEFVREFRLELERLSVASKERDRVAEQNLEQLRQKIDRIVHAIAEGTDTPSLRDALLRLEVEKSELSRSPAKTSRQPASGLPNVDLHALFRQKIEGLEHALGSDPAVRTQRRRSSAQ